MNRLLSCRFAHIIKRLYSINRTWFYIDPCHPSLLQSRVYITNWHLITPFISLFPTSHIMLTSNQKWYLLHTGLVWVQFLIGIPSSSSNILTQSASHLHQYWDRARRYFLEAFSSLSSSKDLNFGILIILIIAIAFCQTQVINQPITLYPIH